MFDKRSRYNGSPMYATTDEQGRTVRAVRLPLPTQPRPAGRHRLRQGERLDLLAAGFLGDPTAFWRIADANNTMWPDDLLVVGGTLIIPVKEI
jgi:hypothetical protein